MSDPVTNNYSLVQPTVGGDLNTWGGILNAGTIAALDSVLGASFAVAITSSDVTLSASQFQNTAFVVTGALTGNRSLIIPLSPNSATAACGGRFVVANDTTGAFTLTVKTAASGSVGVAVPQGNTSLLYSDGTNVIDADNSKVQLIPFSGNPNGFVAGTAGSLNNPPSTVWDYTNALLYFCTTTGDATSAVWVQQQVEINRGFNAPINLSLSATRTGGNLLQVAVKTTSGADPSLVSPVVCAFQTVSAGNTTGGVTNINVVAPLSMNTNATGASLGSVSAVPFRIWFALFNNAGAAVLAMLNASTATSVYPISEQGVASTTGVSGSATSVGVWYTPNGVSLSNCAYRLIGYCEYTAGLTTAGTYTADPSNVVVFGPGVRKPGDVIQSPMNYTGVYASGTTVIPADNTIPQITEGDQYMTQAITPTSKINLLQIETQGFFTQSGPTVSTMALFNTDVDATNALAAASIVISNNPLQIKVDWTLRAPTTAPSTFRIRAGGTAGTMFFNGGTSGQLLGGVANSYLRVYEIMG